jgi:hypothetical protein
MGSVVGTVNAKIRKKTLCRTTSRAKTKLETHYEKPKIKIFLIYYLFLIYLFISLLNKQIRYGNNQKTEKRNKPQGALHFA